MEYFIFDDSFHLHNHAALTNHLRPYRIRPFPLPFTSNNLPKYLATANQIVILVPHSLLPKYESLRTQHVSVEGYGGEA